MSRDDASEIKFVVIGIGCMMAGLALQYWGFTILTEVFEGQSWPYGLWGIFPVAFLGIGLLLWLHDLMVVYTPGYDGEKNADELALTKGYVSYLYLAEFMLLYIAVMPRRLHERL